MTRREEHWRPPPNAGGRPATNQTPAQPTPHLKPGSSVPRLADVAEQLRIQAGCPLLRAALATGDPACIATVLVLHPPKYCPAARRRAAA